MDPRFAAPLPAPQFHQENPLQMMSQMQGVAAQAQQMQQRQQEMEQTERLNKAKQAIGVLATQAIDPKTGDLDTVKLLSMAAQHPDASIEFPNLTKQMLDYRHVDAQRLGVEMETRAKQLDMMSGAFGSLVQDPDVQANNANAHRKIQGALAKLGKDAVMEDGWAMNKYMEYKQLVDSGQMTPSQFVTQSALQGKNGREAMASSIEQYKYMTEPVKYFARTPEGQYAEYMMPRHAYERQMAEQFGQPGAQPMPGQNVMPPQGGGMNPAAPSSAPLGAADRQEGSPSAPPAARRPGLLASLPAGEAEFERARSEKNVALDNEIAEGARLADESSRELQELAGRLAKAPRTGMFAPEQLTLAKSVAFFDPENKTGLQDFVLGETDPQKIAEKISSAEGFSKGSLLARTKTMQQSLGSGQKFTNLEFSTFDKTQPGDRMTPEGIIMIYNYIEKLNNLAQMRNLFRQHWKDEKYGTPALRDVSAFESAWAKYLSRNKDLYEMDGLRKNETKE